MNLPRPEDKEQAVQEMFTSIAPYYDLNNSLLSFGLHHRWKRLAVKKVEARNGEKILDLCTGTADLALRLAREMGKDGRVVALDLNEEMLRLGGQKIRHALLENQVFSLLGNALTLPFTDGTFHAVTVAFGIRNVSDIETAFRETLRILRPGGKMVCLEFSLPQNLLIRKLYHFYSFNWLPWIASLVSGDRTGTYRYLPASIRSFYDPERFKKLLVATGFKEVSYRRMTGGIVAIHTGFKPIA